MKSFLKHSIGLILLVLLSGCSTIEFQKSNLDANEFVVWSADRKLSESDFTGKIPSGAIDQIAHVSFNIPAQYSKLHSLLPMKVQITACVSKRNSWFNKTKANAGSLEYFQLIFDVYELHARMLRKEVSELKINPLNPSFDIASMLDDTEVKVSEMVSQIENETESGRNIAKLKKWQDEINLKLHEMELYQ